MIEKVKAEVQRLKEKYSLLEDQAIARNDDDEDIAFYQGKRKACDEILTFIGQL